jgi:hypothetical protein
MLHCQAHSRSQEEIMKNIAAAALCAAASIFGNPLPGLAHYASR